MAAPPFRSIELFHLVICSMDWAKGNMSRIAAILVSLLLSSLPFSFTLAQSSDLDKLINRDSALVVECQDVNGFLDDILDFRLFQNQNWNDAIDLLTERDNPLLPGNSDELIWSMVDQIQSLNINDARVSISGSETAEWFAVLSMDGKNDFATRLFEITKIAGQLAGIKTSGVDPEHLWTSVDYRGFQLYQLDGRQLDSTPPNNGGGPGSDEDAPLPARGISSFFAHQRIAIGWRDGVVIIANNENHARSKIDLLLDSDSPSSPASVERSRSHKIMRAKLAPGKKDHFIQIQAAPDFLFKSQFLEQEFRTLEIDQIVRVGVSIGFCKTHDSDKTKSMCATGYLLCSHPKNGIFEVLDTLGSIDEFPATPKELFYGLLVNVGDGELRRKWNEIVDASRGLTRRLGIVLQKFSLTEPSRFEGPVIGFLYFRNEEFKLRGLLRAAQVRSQQEHFESTRKQVQRAAANPQMQFKQSNDKFGRVVLRNDAMGAAFTWFDGWFLLTSTDWLDHPDSIRILKGTHPAMVYRSMLEQLFMHRNEPFLICQIRPFLFEPFLHQRLLQEASRSAFAENMAPEKRLEVANQLIQKLNSTPVRENIEINSPEDARFLANMLFLRAIYETFGSISIVASSEEDGLRFSGIFQNDESR